MTMSLTTGKYRFGPVSLSRLTTFPGTSEYSAQAAPVRHLNPSPLSTIWNQGANVEKASN